MIFHTGELLLNNNNNNFDLLYELIFNNKSNRQNDKNNNLNSKMNKINKYIYLYCKLNISSPIPLLLNINYFNKIKNNNLFSNIVNVNSIDFFNENLVFCFI
jgi:hypothetical protein